MTRVGLTAIFGGWTIRYLSDTKVKQSGLVGRGSKESDDQEEPCPLSVNAVSGWD